MPSSSISGGRKGNHDKIRSREIDLVNHFRNKERIAVPKLKDEVIYEGTTEVFDKILQQDNQKGSAIFQSRRKEIYLQDPFRPEEMSKKRQDIIGCLPKDSPKPRGASDSQRKGLHHPLRKLPRQE